MPLSINVGLSRKASKDYQSTGYSINVTAELDQLLLARPEELQDQIAGLYSQAEQALDRQAGATPGEVPVNGRSQPSAPRPGNGNGRARVSPATESQKRAIQAICRRTNSDPELECREIIGCHFVELNIKGASQLIDHLKTLEPADSGRGGGQ